MARAGWPGPLRYGFCVDDTWSRPSGPPGHGLPAPVTSPVEPSGLFPRERSRPAYREPFPATPIAMFIAVVAGSVWMLMWGLLSQTAAGFLQCMLVAGVAATGVALGLARFGDRGAAAGVAIAAGGGLSLAGLVVIVHVFAGNWLS